MKKFQRYRIRMLNEPPPLGKWYFIEIKYWFLGTWHYVEDSICYSFIDAQNKLKEIKK